MAGLPQSVIDEGEAKIRIKLDFTKNAIDAVIGMQEATAAKTKAEVIRNALQLYDAYLRRKADGYELQAVKDGQVEPFDFMRF